MAQKTTISWTDATWNPVRGCERVSEGCRNCYAEMIAARYSGVGQWANGLAKYVERPGGEKEARWTGVIQPVEHMLLEPMKWRKPRRIFVNSMSDLFHERVPFEYIDRVYAVMALAPQHTYQVLTKRPDVTLKYMSLWPDGAARYHHVRSAAHSMLNKLAGKKGWTSNDPEFSRAAEALKVWPLPNVWHGVSAEDQDTFDARVELLGQVPSAVRFVSAEPLLGWIDVGNAFDDPPDAPPQFSPIDQIIVGGESGSGFREMDMEAARWLIKQCKLSKKAIFVKQDSGPRPGMRGRFTQEEFELKQYPEARGGV